MLRRFFKSIAEALHGLAATWRTEQNFRLQAAAAVVVLGLLLIFPLERWERAMLLLLVGLVLILELINTALERLSDLLKPRLHDYVAAVKQIMAGTVLVGSLTAAIVAAVIFYPYFINWLK